MPDDSKLSRPLTVPAGPGKAKATRARHGIASWVDSKRMPKGRSFTKTRRELGNLRTELIRRRGGDEKISPEELILIDSIIEALGVQKLLGLYVRKYGIVDAPSAKRGRLELAPILSKSWVSYANVVRQAVLALEVVKASKVEDGPLDIRAYIADFDARKESAQSEEAVGGPTQDQGEAEIGALGAPESVPGGPTEAAEGNGQGQAYPGRLREGTGS
jgi:hypothetical protein